MTYHFQQLINGEWCNAQANTTWNLINPATEEVIQQVPFGDDSDALTAIDAASDAFPDWALLTPYERGDYLMRAADWVMVHLDDLARFTTEESGKPLSESLAEWRSATNYMKWFAEEGKRAYGRIIPARTATRRIHVTHQPLGVVATITAWNFPIYNIIRTWAAALAAGCTVVGRPSEYTPRSAMLLAQAFYEAGLPKGVLNVVNGDPEAIGQAFLEDERVRKIAFTGSTRVGKLLMDGASKTVTRLALELGGNAPVLVFPDADIQHVAELSVAWKFRNCGQVCVSPQRFFVHSQIAEEFIDTVSDLTQKVKLGNGLDPETQVGPLINARQRERVMNLVDDALTQGAQLIAGGGIPDHLDQGYFYQPAVVTNLTVDMPLYHQETFGPVLPILPFDDVDHALALANDSEYGLAAFVMTQNLNTALTMSERLEYGMICINDWLPATPEAPFGGVKQSGMGRETGSEGLLEYMETKTVFFGGVG
jgi:succinate-semialdehyde dehydrogenase/glutarate-semialdehyde dehydrogenase